MDWNIFRKCSYKESRKICHLIVTIILRLVFVINLFFNSMSGYKKYKGVKQNDLDFLINNGLLKTHKILDIGCGGGRLGIPLIQYLEPNNYYGFDKEPFMMKAFNQTIKQLKLKDYNLYTCDFNLPDFNVKFDFIYAFSVLTHNTREEIANLLNKLKPYVQENTKFYASIHLGKKYTIGQNHPKRKNEFLGVWYSVEELQNIAKASGYKGEFIGTETHSWEGVERTLFDNSISLTKNPDLFTPYMTKLCNQEKCPVSPHTHGTHQEMMLFTLLKEK